MSRSEPRLCFLSPDTCTCSPLPSSGSRGRSLRSPAVPHLHRYCGFVRLLVHIRVRLWSPLAIAFTALVSGEMASSPGFLGNPFGNMPRASDSGDFGPPFAIAVVPDTAFRHFNDVGIATIVISELNLHGLLPCCVRFAPTSRPANGNTRYRPAR